MDFARREIALIFLAIGILLICIAAWMDHRRKDRMMPYLVAPMALKVFGAAIVFIALVVAILPSRF